MKKSELRKIIRESVKGLMAEQSGPCDPTTHKRLRVKFCPGATNVLGDPMPTHSNSMIHCTQIDGQVPGPQHVGTIVEKPSNYNCFACTTYEVVEVLDDYHPQGMQMIGNLQTLPGCPINPNTPPTSGCDPSAWSNHANWTATFTNTVTNANNPCNFLNNKIAQFTNQIPNVGPVWANQLQCKLDLCNQLHASNNC